MSFAWPTALLSLGLIPIALVAYVLVQRRRVKYAVRFTNLDLLANVVDRSPGWRRHVPPLFALVALAALLVALARPQTSVAVPRDEASVVMALDVSGSMLATDVPPTRLDAAKKAASKFVEELPERFRVGLVSFSTGATALAEPTDDRDEILELVDGLEAHTGTAIGDAIAAALELAPEQDADEDAEPATDEDAKPLFSILLLSDGASTMGISVDDAVGLAEDAGVAIHTIALGTDAGTVTVPNELGELQTVQVAPDRETLQEIAEATGGEYFDAPTEADLEAVYEAIGSQVAWDEEKREVTVAFAAAGALFLLLGSALSALWFGRLP
ncbi:MAG TPA: VWA domain-containing protein [Gaiella sp.]|jgi:Ca-activated chloride channel family protein|nr:VWA domain-containing protein [Gaiella sp.]